MRASLLFVVGITFAGAGFSATAPVTGGVVDTSTGQFYPSIGNGLAIDPSTGDVLVPGQSRRVHRDDGYVPDDTRTSSFSSRFWGQAYHGLPAQAPRDYQPTRQRRNRVTTRVITEDSCLGKMVTINPETGESSVSCM